MIRSIKEKLKRPKDDDKLTILNNLVQNCTERPTRPSTSEKWVDAVDRGGLVRITDSTFQFSIPWNMHCEDIFT